MVGLKIATSEMVDGAKAALGTLVSTAKVLSA
jgi:hypothetical protein